MKKLIVWSLVISHVRASPDCLWKRAGGKPWQLHRRDEDSLFLRSESRRTARTALSAWATTRDSPYFNTLDFYQHEVRATPSPFSQPLQDSAADQRMELRRVQRPDGTGIGTASCGDYNEESLAAYRSNGLEPGATSLSQLIEIFQGVGGFDLYSTYDCQDQVHEVFTFDYIQKTLAAGNPIMVGWNDWGGHWQVIIGYDTMGTETTQDDVVIVADPYDTTDHNQDGYGVYSAERFLYNFTFYNFFDDASGELNDMCFLVATPQ